MTHLDLLKKIVGPSNEEYQRLSDVVLRDMTSQPDGNAAHTASLDLTPDGPVFVTEEEDHSHAVSRLDNFINNHIWLVHPQTTRQKLASLSFWGALAAGVITLFVYLFPRFVDNVVTPATEGLKRHLTPVEIGLVVIAAITLLPVLFITHTPFIWLSAIVLGFEAAVAVVQIGTMMGASLTFGLGKTLLHRPALKVLQRYEKIRAVLLAVHKAGAFKVALLMRLGPIPYSACNYISSIPHSITFPYYFLATFIGTLPYNVLEVYLGHNIHGIAALLKGEPVNVWQVAWNLVGMFASIVVVVAGFVYAKRALEELRQQEESEEASASATEQGLGSGTSPELASATNLTPMIGLRTATMEGD